MKIQKTTMTLLLAIGVGAISAMADPVDYSHTIQTHITASGNNSGFSSRNLSGGRGIEERCEVLSGARTDNTLDPRVERHYTRSIPADTTDDYEWSGLVFVDRANETTFFQLLNTDVNDPNGDRHRPVLFLEAYRFTNSNGDTIVRISDGKWPAPQVAYFRNESNFLLRVRVIDGRRAQVYVNNSLRYTKDFDRYADQPGIQLPRSSRTQVRFGAYHHDTRVVRPAGSPVKEAVSTATIRVRNPTFGSL